MPSIFSLVTQTAATPSSRRTEIDDFACINQFGIPIKIAAIYKSVAVPGEMFPTINPKLTNRERLFGIEEPRSSNVPLP